jgi:hypothetical protein
MSIPGKARCLDNIDRKRRATQAGYRVTISGFITFSAILHRLTELNTRRFADSIAGARTRASSALLRFTINAAKEVVSRAYLPLLRAQPTPFSRPVKAE